MPKVRLTIRPDEETEVPEDEVAVLRSQGLLIEDTRASAAPSGAPSPASAAGSAAAGGKPADTGKEG